MSAQFYNRDDPAHEADMEELRREQLEADFGPSDDDQEEDYDTWIANRKRAMRGC